MAIDNMGRLGSSGIATTSKQNGMFQSSLTSDLLLHSSLHEDMYWHDDSQSESHALAKNRLVVAYR